MQGVRGLGAFRTTSGSFNEVLGMLSVQGSGGFTG